MLLFELIRNDVRHKNIFGILDITKDNINFRFNTKLGLVCIDRGNLKNSIEILTMRIGKIILLLDIIMEDMKKKMKQ